MKPDTTTELLIIHERELQRRPRTKLQCALVNLLAKAAVASAERDRKVDGRPLPWQKARK